MERLAVGSKEYLIVDVTDRLGNLDNLDGITCTYDVKDTDGIAKYTNASAITVSGKMLVKCLVDTTGWATGEYELWITLQLSPEVPRLGPYEFKVE